MPKGEFTKALLYSTALLLSLPAYYAVPLALPVFKGIIYQTGPLPFTAWEQAVFVVLLIVLVIRLLSWFSNENKLSRQFQASESKARADAHAAESAARDKEQKERDNDWREYLRQQRESDIRAREIINQNFIQISANINEGLDKLKESLDILTTVSQTLLEEVREQRADFLAHDKREWAKLDEMSAAIHHQTKKVPRNP